MQDQSSDASPASLILPVPVLLRQAAPEMQAAPDGGQAGPLHPVSHLALHAAPPPAEEPLPAVHGATQLLCSVVVVTEAAKAGQQHAHLPAKSRVELQWLLWGI